MVRGYVDGLCVVRSGVVAKCVFGRCVDGGLRGCTTSSGQTSCEVVVAAGANPALISKGIDKTAEALAHELNIMSKGNKARNNPEAGSMISEAMNKVGKSGVVGAVEEGIVIGGGCTFLGLADKVDHIKDTLENVEEKVGADIVKKALSNAGEGGSVVSEEVVSGSLDHAVTTAKWFLMPDVKGPGAPKPVDTTVVLGKGAFGTTLEVTIEDTSTSTITITTVVVKVLAEVVVGRREFEQQLEIIGKIRHDNLAELEAYCYSKDENSLFIATTDKEASSRCCMRGMNDRVRLDWESRLRIATGAARGLAKIHEANDGTFNYGNIKSSNIFLNSRSYGCIGDTGLATIMKSLPQTTCLASGYHAPEVTDTRRSTQCSDVYSFGVVLLEL
ncbi:hypothetical protein Bca52824_066647 [Brassica carinata]|uniref:Protein kinase domain-containing protein n=2 Tax=Brassica TaxID=3705 RepID=A0A8X7QL41_BRACI|nr:hypothetical protein Bca52824_066647 [Brassica carinata]